MIHMLQKRYMLDSIGSKTALRILRVLYQNLNMYRSISQIARYIETSRTNVHRGLKELKGIGIIRSSKDKGRSMVRIDTSSRLALPFFSLFNAEEYLRIAPHVREIISMVFPKESPVDLSLVVLFGSYSRHEASPSSDIDILVVSKNMDDIGNIRRSVKNLLPEHRIEIHGYYEKDMTEPRDLVVVDALIYGIAIKGEPHLMKFRSELEWIDSSYLVWRLNSSRENMDRAMRSESEGKAYFNKVAWTTLGEVEAILNKGKTVSKADINREGSFQERVESSRLEISKRGDRIWLT